MEESNKRNTKRDFIDSLGMETVYNQDGLPIDYEQIKQEEEYYQRIKQDKDENQAENNRQQVKAEDKGQVKEENKKGDRQ